MHMCERTTNRLNEWKINYWWQLDKRQKNEDAYVDICTVWTDLFVWEAEKNNEREKGRRVGDEWMKRQMRQRGKNGEYVWPLSHVGKWISVLKRFSEIETLLAGHQEGTDREMEVRGGREELREGHIWMRRKSLVPAGRMGVRKKEKEQRNLYLL